MLDKEKLHYSNLGNSSHLRSDVKARIQSLKNQTYLKTMTKFIKLLSLLFIVAVVFSACGDDEVCEGASCPAGQVLTVDCLCVETDPTVCDGKICAAGEILDASTCDCVGDGSGATEIVNASGFLGSNTTWTADKVYVLTGKVVVGDGSTLTIEPGTIIKGEDDPGSLASALIVAQGGTIRAEGTADSPIIFTTINDNIMPGEKLSPNLDEFANSEWGGLIILGYAPVSAGDGDFIAQIEGIPADDIFGRYGGDDPTDNSGILRYVSIRHGGISIGADNEINGLTLGGVGSGTVIENVEVVANKDDGIEWFGGTR